MSVLIIAEKPSVARGIAEAVGAHERKDGFIAGNGYVLSWCHGHLVGLDLPREYPEFARVGMGDLPMVPTEWRWHVSGLKVLCSCPECGSPVVLSRSGGQWQCSASKWDPDHDFKLVSGDGFKINVKQFGKKLTENQARSIASGKPTVVKGLKKKDGSTFDAKLVLGPKPYSGWAELAPREAKPATKRLTGRKSSGNKYFAKRER